MNGVFSLADTLARLRPQLLAARLPEAGLAAVLETARGLPAQLGDCIYLEVWLQGDTQRVDLIVRIEPPQRALLEELGAAADVDRAGGHRGWRRVIEFARSWALAGSSLDHLVAGAWIEFDLGPHAAQRPVEPRVFVDFVRSHLDRLTREERQALVQAVLEPLRGAGPTVTELACLDALPPLATLPYVGVDVAAANPGLRLCLRGLGAALPAYLRDVGWPGDVEHLAQQILVSMAAAQGAADGGTTLLHIDVDRERGVAPRVGLEYAFTRLCQVQGRLAEGDLLALLVRRGWCDADALAGLRAWPGQTIELLPHQIWHSRVGRRVNHVKLTYASGEPIGLKAYLCVYEELLADGTLVGSSPRHFGSIARATGVRSRAPLNGAGAPATPVAAAEPRAKPAVESVELSGTRIAYTRQRGGHPMTMTAKEQHVLEAVLQRSVVDHDFRKLLLHDPRRAMQELGVSVPANFRVKFIEKDKNVDALVVLPNFECAQGELSEDELETVAGGGGRRPPVDPDWGEVP